MSPRRGPVTRTDWQSTLPCEPPTAPVPLESQRRRATARLAVIAILVALGCAWLALHSLFRLLHG